MSIKDEWIKKRAAYLAGPLSKVDDLLRAAEDAGVRFEDDASRENIARAIAMREWKNRSKDSYPPAELTAERVRALKDDVRREIDEVMFHGDEFNAMESGPMEEPEPVGPQPQTSSGWLIYEVLLPEFLERFFAKNADYGDQHRAGLGAAAEYVGIHRKVEKLKRALWDGQEMNGEGAREMLFDLIGQCFIVLDLIAMEEAKQ